MQNTYFAAFHLIVKFVSGVGKKSELRIQLQKNGYSKVVANRIWDWYTGPTEKRAHNNNFKQVLFQKD